MNFQSDKASYGFFRFNFLHRQFWWKSSDYFYSTCYFWLYELMNVNRYSNRVVNYWNYQLMKHCINYSSACRHDTTNISRISDRFFLSLGEVFILREQECWNGTLCVLVKPFRWIRMSFFNIYVMNRKMFY